MLAPSDFVEELKKRGISNFTGVPCSFFQSAINYVIDDKELSYSIVPNEGSALALASGAILAGKQTVVLIQNSGLGNLINPLTSLNMIYGIPVLIFISGRAYGVLDEPQHEIMGKSMGAILDAIGIPHRDMPDTREEYDNALGDALELMKKNKQPFVFFVRKGAIDTYVKNEDKKNKYPLKRIEVLKIISEFFTDDVCAVATTGMISRELFAVADRKQNFYMQGSMGHASAFGLGIALSKPEKKVVVLDGDGAFLMHMGIGSSIGHYQPKNMYHIVLDNEAYESTGNQDTTSRTTDILGIARACGYVSAHEVETESELRSMLKELLASQGPALLRVKVNREATEGIPRISSKYASEDIANNVKWTLNKETEKNF